MKKTGRKWNSVSRQGRSEIHIGHLSREAGRELDGRVWHIGEGTGIEMETADSVQKPHQITRVLGEDLRGPASADKKRLETEAAGTMGLSRSCCVLVR